MIGLNVLTLTNEFEEETFGGAGTAVTGMVYMLDRSGVRQTVVMPRSDRKVPGWAVRGQNIKVLGLPRNPHYFGHLGMIRADVALKEFTELAVKWDLIHIHAINFTPLAYVLAKGPIPILYSVYSFLRKELEDPPEPELQAQFNIQEELLLRCRQILLISRSEQNYLADRFPQCIPKTKVLPLGISLPAERWQQGPAGDFLYVGRLLDYKGIDDLIMATDLIRRSGRSIHLNIVGSGPQSYEDKIKQRVRLMNLGLYVHFHGWLPGPEMRRLMSRATALVVPSRREAYGLVALEGMAMGTPLIASSAGGLAELVSPSCALIFEAGNVKQLSETLMIALNNPSLLRTLAAQGREKALYFQWEQLAPRYLAAIKLVKN